MAASPAGFGPQDARGSDGHLHEEMAALACSCGFRAAVAEEMDSHFLAAFTPAGSVGRDGEKHEPIAVA
jgi:hypothetical protein